MARPALYVIICVLLTILPGLSFAAPDMQPGRWEITSILEMPGMAFTMPATKHTQCITAEELVPQAQQENSKCQVVDQSIDGNVVTWQVRCESGGGTMDSQGKITYHGDSFEGMVVTNGSQMPSEMTQKMTGKRIGQCN